MELDPKSEQDEIDKYQITPDPKKDRVFYVIVLLVSIMALLVRLLK